MLLGASLLCGASALAAGSGEHSFGFSFGSAGTAAGQFTHPSGIAASSSGEVYVADQADSRVEEFKSLENGAHEVTGIEYVAAFPVTLPGQVAVDNCESEGHPCTTATDPSVGDVYVAGVKKAKSGPSEDKILYKLSPSGAPLGTIKFKEPIEGVAVDPAGTLYVYELAGTLHRFSDAEANVVEGKKNGVQSGLLGVAKPGLALNSKDDAYIGSGLNSPAPEEAAQDGPLASFFAEVVTQYRNLHGTEQPVVTEVEAASGQPLVRELDYEPTTAVAVDPAEGLDNVYAVNVEPVSGTTIATFGPESEPPAGSSNLVERHGALIQRFAAPGLEGPDAVAVDPANGAVFAVGGASDTVDVFNELRDHPTASGLEAVLSPEDAATLEAKVNPTGVQTHAYFEYAREGGTCESGPCTRVSATPEPGEGYAPQQVSVTLPDLPPGTYHYRVTVEGGSGTPVASPERTFTIVAPINGLPDGRAWEMVSPPEKNGAEPEAPTREGGVIQAAADGKAITYVADGPIPPHEAPAGNRNPEYTQVLSTRGAQEWESKNLTTAADAGAGVAPGHAPEYQLFSTNLALALVDPYFSLEGNLASPPLAPALEGEEGKQENTIYLGDALAEESLEADSEQQRAEAANNYQEAEQNGKLMHNRGFLPLVTAKNAPNGEAFGESQDAAGLVPQGATPDLSHVVFDSDKAGSGLYEWGGPERDKALALVSELPEGGRVPAGAAGLGGRHDGAQDASPRHAISNDGSLVFWTYSAGGGTQHLYARDTQTEQTLQIDAPTPGEAAKVKEIQMPASEVSDPVFATASADGKRVFFTDTQRLTQDSRTVVGSPDLYVFEPDTAGPTLSGTLTDLTAHEGADVLVNSGDEASVLGASEDGSYVYFVANGVLAPDARHGDCNPTAQARPPGATCNLYLSHYDANTEAWEPTKLIAALSSEDNPDWGGGASNGNLTLMTSRVSPDGRYLAFMSDRSLTGYDNEDVSSKHPGERMDEEVYLYGAAAGGRLVCASCDPTGARPRGVYDTGLLGSGAHEGLGLVVDRPEVWGPRETQTDHWLAGSIPGWTALYKFGSIYQSRYLSDSGRLFFNSADPLVPLATPTKEETANGETLTVGNENVYEYEPAAVGGCNSEGGCVGLISSGTSSHESVFLDASENGNDVFFLTAAQLTPQDGDTSFDIYDAHVCEADSPCTSPPASKAPEACAGEEGEGCTKPYAPLGLSLSAPASTALSAGNPLGGVLKFKLEEPPKKKPLTRAQKLALALKACRKDKGRSKRLACEKQARKKYGPLKKPAAKKSTARQIPGKSSSR